MMYEPGPPDISKIYPDTKNQLVTVIGQLYPHQSALFVNSRVAPSHKSMIATKRGTLYLGWPVMNLD